MDSADVQSQESGEVVEKIPRWQEQLKDIRESRCDHSSKRFNGSHRDNSEYKLDLRTRTVTRIGFGNLTRIEIANLNPIAVMLGVAN